MQRRETVAAYVIGGGGLLQISRSLGSGRGLNIGSMARHHGRPHDARLSAEFRTDNLQLIRRNRECMPTHDVVNLLRACTTRRWASPSPICVFPI